MEVKNFKPGMQIGGNAAQIHGKPGTYKERKAAYMKQKAHAANNAGPQPAAAVSLQQSASVPPPPPLPAPAQPAFQVDMNMLADFAFQMSNMMEVAKDMHIAQGGSMNQMVAPQTFGNAAQALFDANTRRAAEMVQRQAAQQSVFNAVPPPPPPPPSSAQMDRRLTTVIANDVDVDSL